MKKELDKLDVDLNFKPSNQNIQINWSSVRGKY